MKIHEILEIGKNSLKQAKIINYPLEAEIILSHILDIERYKLYIEKTDVSKLNARKYLCIIKKRALGLPLAYLTKSIYFWNDKFDIKPGVFIPRPETELLIETATHLFSAKDKPSILDIGTGCGVLAISLAKEFPAGNVIAVDISKKAITLSKENAKNIGVLDRIVFFQSSICSLFPGNKTLYDLIVSNPPYLSENEMKNLPREVKKEPKKALDGGKNGLKYHKKIIEYSKKFLKKSGYLLMEISPRQKGFFLNSDFSPLTTVEIKKDFCGLDRMVTLSF